VNVTESEIVGLVPQGALNACSRFYLQLNNFKRDQILENKLESSGGGGFPEFLNELASSKPTPGGGSAAALNGALGVALMTMVAKLTVGKKGYEEFDEELAGVRDRLVLMRGKFIDLVDEDAAAFKSVMAAFKLPKMTEADKQARAEAVSEALKGAAEAPLRTMHLALDGLRLARPVVEHGNKSSISDAGVGTMNLNACFHGARLNVLINLPSIKDESFVKAKQAELERLQGEFDGLVKEYLARVFERMG
jgi:formiminotetrahydrofolate cyclodeaminase